MDIEEFLLSECPSCLEDNLNYLPSKEPRNADQRRYYCRTPNCLYVGSYADLRRAFIARYASDLSEDENL